LSILQRDVQPVIKIASAFPTTVNMKQISACS